MDATSDVLRELGQQVREFRGARRLTLAGLAERAGLSRRYLGDLEKGRANISILGLLRVADALGVEGTELLAQGSTPERRTAVRLLAQLPEPRIAEASERLLELAQRRREPARYALVGLRGAGKTTIGRRVAAQASLRFVELDRRIEEAAGMPLGDLFPLHGEAYYRALEHRALQEVVREPMPTLLEVGGGIVSAPESYALLRAHFTTIWLCADPEDHLSRVIEQGDHRPVKGHPSAMARLRELLQTRSTLYSLTDHRVETSRAPLDQVVGDVRRIVAGE